MSQTGKLLRGRLDAQQIKAGQLGRMRMGTREVNVLVSQSKDKTVESVPHGKRNISDRSVCHQKQSDQVCGLRGRALQQTPFAHPSKHRI